MERYIYDKNNGLLYELQGDYYKMEWVGQMNNVRHRISEIVNGELIYR